ncbi:hypothetical protein [Alloactinosynnema sp. L-07]|uniref:hypothetical protein n=1 Tax=Alloactinosynnema sp. L-07 TaxID=1653480 RepID=UPI00065F0922|nr:hypothetical protein [Alloactinosynnema sp. L-07]CRK61821.1 hypothetical protein [Alloactinosynnema sp. L-07]
MTTAADPDPGKPITGIAPATNARYDRLVAAGVIRAAARSFDMAELPEPVPNSTGRSILDWLDDLRGSH